MTSRLKRKLNDLGVDTGSSKANENFCLIGTPLPPLEKSKDTGEFVPLWKQEVRDEKGRRRLHGAFTGGFSAGYFNTVGSKEGWAPSEFRSSRSDRAKKKAVKPEDFMDEEDLVELRDNQKLVDTTGQMDMDFWERRKAASSGEEKDSVESALAAALLPAPSDSVGAQILKKMGWRVGHGIGPKVTFERRKRQDALSHVLAGPEDVLPDLEDHDEAKRHLYPRRDTKVPVMRRKDDKHGLGYERGPGLTQLVAPVASTTDRTASKQGQSISVGFGLGALNDADEDDLDVYDTGPGQTSRRLVYVVDEHDEHIVMGNRSRNVREASPLQPQGTSRVPASKTVFGNGLPCLPGFIVAEKPVTEDNMFPPPAVPEDWEPDPHRVWEKDKENLKTGPSVQNEARPVLKQHHSWRQRIELTANQRGDLLGEAPIPAAPRSVFDYLKPKDRERLKNLAGGHVKPLTASVGVLQSEPGPTISEQAPMVPRLDPQIAKMALQGFQPFTNDPIKQFRYTAYLKAQAAEEDTVPFSHMPGQAADAFRRELEDYARSARIFKPVSGAMAGRFTSAAVVDTNAKASEGLHRPAQEGTYLPTPSEVEREESVKEESPKENAARMGMFGPLTREVKPWVPARLLCKRFGVKEPEVELQSDQPSAAGPSGSRNWETREILSIAGPTEAGLTGSTRMGEGETTGNNGLAKASSSPERRDISNIGLGDEDETQGRDILTYERPGMDIFKAIFASDEEDEGELEEEVDGGDADGQGASGQSERSSLGIKASEQTRPDGDRTPPRETPIDYNNMAGKVDVADFKPTFVARTDRAKAKEKDRRGKEKDREKDREKKQRHKVALVSFEVDEEGGEGDRDAGTEEKRRKKKSEKKTDAGAPGDEDGGLWVEKPPPETVKNFVPPVAASESETSGTPVAEECGEAGPPRGRKRAIDFM